MPGCPRPTGRSRSRRTCCARRTARPGSRAVVPLLAARARVAVVPIEVDLQETRALLAIGSIAAAVVHAAVVPEHLGEGWAHAAFFVVVAALQLGWALALLRRPSRTLLRVGVGLGFAVAAVWALSRTVGVPVGPRAWRPEAVGPVDLLTTYTELLTAGGCLLLLRGADAWRLRLLRGMLLLVVVLTLTAVFTVAHRHQG